jgi:hypothetical protein
MAYALAVQHKEGPSGAGAVRGTVIHEIFAAYVTHLWHTRRQTDWEECANIAARVLEQHPELNYEQVRDVLSQADNIARGYLFEPGTYYGSEELLATTISINGGRSVRITGRLDLLEVDQDEGWARITDAKSNHMVPADSAVQDDFQLRTYALLVMDNLSYVERVYGQLWLTRYNIFCPQRREAVWTRDDIEQFREHLTVRLGAFVDGKLAREFVPGTWCQYCPRRRPSDCTLWRHSPALQGPITTPVQAERVAARIIAQEQRLDGLKAALKAYVNDNGPVRVGSTAKAETFGFHARETEDVPASALLEIAEVARDLVGDVDINELLSPNRTSKAYKMLRRHPELAPLFEAVVRKRLSTVFGHKSI